MASARALEGLSTLYFPHLEAYGYRVTSNRTSRYNCIAWAAGDNKNWCWPDREREVYCPTEPRKATRSAFIKAFRTLGYEVCSSGRPEHGLEKIALFFDGDEPRHAARQLANGTWTSKLGPDEDIAHVDLEALEGPGYGRIGCFMRRPWKPHARRPTARGRRSRRSRF